MWARVAGFRHEDLAVLLREQKLVRSTMIRRTMHLATAEDYRWLRPTVQPWVDSLLKAAYYRDEIEGVDLIELAAHGKRLLTGRTLARSDLGKLLAEHFPDRHARRLADTVEVLVPLAHGADTGAWGRWRNRYVTVALADEWIGAPLADPDPDALVLRYLAAFGPATVADIQAWSGLTRLAAVITRLRPDLRVFRDEDGRELYDLPDAPVAPADLPTPVRFLPAFDNALLGHKDRRRIIAEHDRRRTAKEASAGIPIYLVDGFAHGRWALESTTIRILPWYPFTPATKRAVLDEAESLLPFIVPDEQGDIVIDESELNAL